MRDGALRREHDIILDIRVFREVLRSHRRSGGTSQSYWTSLHGRRRLFRGRSNIRRRTRGLGSFLDALTRNGHWRGRGIIVLLPGRAILLVEGDRALPHKCATTSRLGARVRLFAGVLS